MARGMPEHKGAGGGAARSVRQFACMRCAGACAVQRGPRGNAPPARQSALAAPGRGGGAASRRRGADSSSPAGRQCNQCKRCASANDRCDLGPSLVGEAQGWQTTAQAAQARRVSRAPRLECLSGFCRRGWQGRGRAGKQGKRSLATAPRPRAATAAAEGSECMCGGGKGLALNRMLPLKNVLQAERQESGGRKSWAVCREQKPGLTAFCPGSASRHTSLTLSLRENKEK